MILLNLNCIIVGILKYAFKSILIHAIKCLYLLMYVCVYIYRERDANTFLLACIQTHAHVLSKDTHRSTLHPQKEINVSIKN